MFAYAICQAKRGAMRAVPHAARLAIVFRRCFTLITPLIVLRVMPTRHERCRFATPRHVDGDIDEAFSVCHARDIFSFIDTITATALHSARYKR